MTQRNSANNKYNKCQITTKSQQRYILLGVSLSPTHGLPSTRCRLFGLFSQIIHTYLPYSTAYICVCTYMQKWYANIPLLDRFPFGIATKLILLSQFLLPLLSLLKVQNVFGVGLKVLKMPMPRAFVRLLYATITTTYFFSSHSVQ